MTIQKHVFKPLICVLVILWFADALDETLHWEYLAYISSSKCLCESSVSE
jgi:hypothetical protein